MSKKILLFSDLHLRPESEEVCFQVLDHVLQTAKQHGCSAIGFLGDFFHLRYQVPVYLLNKVSEWIWRVRTEAIDLHLLPGNHDQIHTNGEHALEVFRGRLHVYVHTQPTASEWGVWMPYRPVEAASKVLQEMPLQGLNFMWKCSRLFAHLPVLGAMMNNTKPDASGLPASTFGGFDEVYLGHYHKPHSPAPNVHYVGSPWQTRADEAGQQKRFLLLSQDQPGFVEIPVHLGRQYFKFHADSPMSLQTQLLELPKPPAPGDHVQLIMPTKSDLDSARKVLQKHGLSNVNGMASDLAVPKPRFGFAKGTSLEKYVAAYVQEKAPAGSFLRMAEYWEKLK